MIDVSQLGTYLTCHKQQLQGHVTVTVKTKRQRLYDDWKRCVLRCFLKVFKEVAGQMCSAANEHSWPMSLGTCPYGGDRVNCHYLTMIGKPYKI